MDSSNSSSSSSSVAAPVELPEQETSRMAGAEGRSKGQPTLSAEVDRRLQDPAVKKKLIDTLRKEVEELDCFWAKLEDHAIDTCGEKASEAVVAAFKGVHTRRVANLNLEQTDTLCRDILLRLVKHDPLQNTSSSGESSSFEEDAAIL